jgi:hypothetical protein
VIALDQPRQGDRAPFRPASILNERRPPVAVVIHHPQGESVVEVRPGIVGLVFVSHVRPARRNAQAPWVAAGEVGGPGGAEVKKSG